MDGISHQVRRLPSNIVDENADRPADLVNRSFDPPAPHRLWVADVMYVPTWSGMVYVVFVIDAFSRRVIGWRAASSMTTTLAWTHSSTRSSLAPTRASPT